MPIKWESFEHLPGAADVNFEKLCRSLIRRHYGQHGEFAALAAQPGVEFHLKLQTKCALGNLGRWYGWQCKWYDLPGGKALGTTRRKNIEEGISKSEKHLPGLTDWVLWTRRPLTKGDQTWFKKLRTKLKLHQWTEDEVEEHLGGDGILLRGTYFTELVLTPDSLNALHDKAIAPIRSRWLPEAHQAVQAERFLRQQLGEPDAWKQLLISAKQLKIDAEQMDQASKGLQGPLASLILDASRAARLSALSLADTHKDLIKGDIDQILGNLRNRHVPPSAGVKVLPRRLRSARHRAALFATNVLAGINQALELLGEVKVSINKRFTVVLASAGCGKTQLSAQVTNRLADRPSGVFIQGRDLLGGQSLDQLAQRISIQGKPIASMEALIAAVDSAGQRAGRRLPVIIDGLNEAEDPRDWKNILPALEEMLKPFPYVLFICTLRSAFEKEALPLGLDHLEIPNFGEDLLPAIRRYFTYYKINGIDADIPTSLLSHPLSLRMFCEVSNPKREKEVGVEALPTSLVGLFEKYLDQVAERVSTLAHRAKPYCQQDVRSALDKIGWKLWENRARSLDLAGLRGLLGDNGCPWNQSIVNALEQDGVLIRDPGDTSSNARMAGTFDLLSGHLIAKAILGRLGRIGFESWLKEPSTLEALQGTRDKAHTLAEDILVALVGLVPRQFHREQLWQMIEDPLRSEALDEAADLEAEYLDSETVNQLFVRATQSPEALNYLLGRLWQTRGVSIHPLNAVFLDSLLRPMGVGARDGCWSEWLRNQIEDVFRDFDRREAQWRNKLDARAPADCLRARWIMWTLTSTARDLRDRATRALYWFGRGDPGRLFELTLDSLAINDPYISERMLAASYGVIMANQRLTRPFIDALGLFLEGLRGSLVGTSALFPTNHWLTRTYVQGIALFAEKFCPQALPHGFLKKGIVSFAPGSSIAPIPNGDPRAEEMDDVMRRDFENYTLGRLCKDRANYDMNHAGHQAAVAHIRGTAWALGWRKASLGTIENRMEDRHRGNYSRSERSLTERYGKKYSWIGFFTYAGLLYDRNQLPDRLERPSDLHLDPSFPEEPTTLPFMLPDGSNPKSKSNRDWVTKGIVPVPDELFYSQTFGENKGPWIAVRGFFTTVDKMRTQNLFGFLTALLVNPQDEKTLRVALETKQYPGNSWAPEPPDDHYTFAGEIPWHPEFANARDWSDAKYMYNRHIKSDSGQRIPVEILAHGFGWESYHSPINQIGTTLIPSKAFSKKLGLVGIPQSFSQALADGTLASQTLRCPSGFEGDFLYLREDLLYRYAKGRKLVWMVWGERGIYPYPDHGKYPDWFRPAAQNNEEIWREIRTGESLSVAFAAKTDKLRRQLKNS